MLHATPHIALTSTTTTAAEIRLQGDTQREHITWLHAPLRVPFCETVCPTKQHAPKDVGVEPE
jgi:hypothetical protein